jgi:hypothetical protein
MSLLKLYRLDKLSIVCTIYVVLFGLFHQCTNQVLTNSYLVKFNEATNRELADTIASRNDFINAGPVSYFLNKNFKINNL